MSLFSYAYYTAAALAYLILPAKLGFSSGRIRLFLFIAPVLFSIIGVASGKTVSLDNIPGSVLVGGYFFFAALIYLFPVSVAAALTYEYLQSRYRSNPWTSAAAVSAAAWIASLPLKLPENALLPLLLVEALCALWHGLRGKRSETH
ncbi:hypothetical protein [Nitratifractor sp.]